MAHKIHVILSRLVPLIALFCLCLLACNPEHVGRPEFTYDPKSGVCKNMDGEIGLNIVDMEKIRKTKCAECLDLSGLNLVYLLDTASIENFNDLGYNKLIDYNFKGTKFDGATLSFNSIYDADFSGADLRGVGYGYAAVAGKIDPYTLLPVSGSCKTASDSVSCTN